MFSLCDQPDTKEIPYWCHLKNDQSVTTFLPFFGISDCMDIFGKGLICYIKNAAFFVASASLLRRRVEE